MARLGRAFPLQPRTAWRQLHAVPPPITISLEGTIGGFPAAGLAAYYKLDEASGTRADSKGTNHLTDVNTVGQASGQLNDAASFVAASSEELTIASNASLELGADSSLLISAWVYLSNPTALVVNGVLAKGSGVVREYELAYVFGFAYQFAIYDSTGTQQTLSHTYTPSANTWHFVCAWHDAVANTINLSVDNGTPTSQAHAGTWNATNTLHIGANTAGQYMDGRIDEVGLWIGTIPSVSERTALYASGAGKAFAASELSGDVTKSAARSVAGSLTPTATLGKSVARVVAGAIPPAGALAKSVARVLTGALTPLGAVANALLKLIDVTGALTPTGALDAEKIVGLLQVSLTGALTPVGTLVKALPRTVAGAITPAGLLTRSLSRALTGALTPAGTLAKRLSRTFAAANTPSGALAVTRVVLLALGGAVAAAGTLGRALGKPLTGVLTPTATLGRALTRTLGGTIVGAGTLARDVARRLAGSVTPQGAVSSSAPSIDPPLDGPILAAAGASQYAAVAGDSQSGATVGASRAAAEVRASEQRATVRGSRYGAGVR